MMARIQQQGRWVTFILPPQKKEKVEETSPLPSVNPSSEATKKAATKKMMTPFAFPTTIATTLMASTAAASNSQDHMMFNNIIETETRQQFFNSSPLFATRTQTLTTFPITGAKKVAPNKKRVQNQETTGIPRSNAFLQPLDQSRASLYSNASD